MESLKHLENIFNVRQPFRRFGDSSEASKIYVLVEPDEPSRAGGAKRGAELHKPQSSHSGAAAAPAPPRSSPAASSASSVITLSAGMRPPGQPDPHSHNPGP